MFIYNVCCLCYRSTMQTTLAVVQNSDTFIAKKQFCEFVANHSLINTTQCPWMMPSINLMLSIVGYQYKLAFIMITGPPTTYPSIIVFYASSIRIRHRYSCYSDKVPYLSQAFSATTAPASVPASAFKSVHRSIADLQCCSCSSTCWLSTMQATLAVVRNSFEENNFARKNLGNFGEKVLQNSDTFFAKKQFCEFVANHSLINTT